MCAFGNMLKSFMHIKNYKRIILILAFFLLYISMYLIHNVYGPVCIIKSSGDKGSSSKGKARNTVYDEEEDEENGEAELFKGYF